jgi:anthranilate synthase component 2
MKRVLLVDNYDSFTWNLVHLLGEVGVTCEVVRNDALEVDEAERRAIAHGGLVISPGPKTPSDAGIVLALLGRVASRVPVLGVCLGHQAIGQAFGARSSAPSSACTAARLPSITTERACSKVSRARSR